MSIESLYASAKWADSRPEKPEGWPHKKSFEADAYAWPVRYVWDATLERYIPEELYQDINAIRFWQMDAIDQRREFAGMMHQVSECKWAKRDVNVMAAIAAYKKPSLWQRFKGWLA